MRAPGADAGARYWHERALSAPTRVVDNLHGISAPTRVVGTSARYIPLAVSTTPSRCQRPPHGADNARPYRQRALELAPGPGALRTRPTTRVHTRGSTRARARRAADTTDNARCPGGSALAKAERAADTIDVNAIDHAHCPEKHPHQGQTPGGLLRIAHHPLGVRTQGPRFTKHAPHTRAEPRPCVRPSVAQFPPLCATPADTDTEKGRSEGADREERGG